MPTVGVGSLESIRAAGGSLLVIEAGRTIFVDRDRVTNFARRSGITIASFFDNQGELSIQSLCASVA